MLLAGRLRWLIDAVLVATRVSAFFGKRNDHFWKNTKS